MVFCIDRRLHVVADDAGTTAARGHRTAVSIRERYLLIGRRQNLFYASGEIDWTGRISKCGDKMLRSYLYEAANVLLTRVAK
ncbi:transposase [Bradyrhizobium sp. 187]|nr:transposase [Bradyrhizobium sp. 187]